MRLIGESDEKKRLELQSDIASLDNARKLYYGRSIQLRRAEVVEKRQAEEAQFTKWIAADPARQQKYGTVLSDIAALTAESNRYAKRDVIVRRIPDPQMTILGQVFSALNRGTELPDSEKPAKLAEIQKALEGREPVYEYEVLKFFLRAFADLPEGQKFDWAEQYFKDKANRRIAEEAFAKSIADGPYWTAATLAALYGPQTMEYRPERDDVKGFVAAALERKSSRYGSGHSVRFEDRSFATPISARNGRNERDHTLSGRQFNSAVLVRQC